MNQMLEAPVQQYLEALELELKQLAGVSPEEALCDAREFLAKDFDSLTRAEPDLDEQEIYDHFVATFGSPAKVAASYAESSPLLAVQLPGYAPGWRLCCTRCGRSVPAAKVGITRIGAYSSDKYTLAYCRECQWLRWVRLIKDEKRTNLTELMGTDTTPEEMRRRLHRPWHVLLMIVGIVVPAMLLLALLLQSGDEADHPLPVAAEGWTIEKSRLATDQQVQLISQRLGGKLLSLTNTVVATGGQSLQINKVECATAGDADRVEASLRRGKPNQRLVHRSGTTVYEFVVRNRSQLRLALAARYAFGIQPRRVKYQVTFDAVPLDSCDPMRWNELFNVLLQVEQGGASAESVAKVNQLKPHFQFGDQFFLRSSGQGSMPSQWSFEPAPVSPQAAGKTDITNYRFDALPERAGIPFVRVTGEITSETAGSLPAGDRPLESLTAATADWPVEDPEIQELAEQVTAKATSPRAKVRTLLAWLAPGANVRYSGDVTGSRYGVSKVLSQKFGHCWDFSDVFVTLCRASGVPCRQVYGWLHNSEGHVWAEVLLDGRWRQVDPTAAAPCGSDYIPFIASETGQMPLLYASKVRIEVLSTSNDDQKP